MKRVDAARSPGGTSLAARGGRVRRALARRALVLAAPLFIAGCDSLLGIDDVERVDEGSGASGGGGGPAAQGGSGGAPGGRSGGGGRAGGPQKGGGGSPTGGSGGSGGGPTGGTGGSPTGGSGGGPLPCDTFDPSGPNDNPGEATPLFGGNTISPCDGNDIVGDAYLAENEDWFSVSVFTPFECFSLPSPQARVEPRVGAEVCYFLTSIDIPPAPFTCLDPAVEVSDGPDGATGCCGVDEVKLEHEGFDAEVVIRVRPGNSVEACRPYSLVYRF